MNPSVEDDRDPVHRYVELINAGDVSASNSAGADACPERRVAPRLDADQDTSAARVPEQGLHGLRVLGRENNLEAKACRYGASVGRRPRHRSKIPSGRYFGIE